MSVQTRVIRGGDFPRCALVIALLAGACSGPTAPTPPPPVQTTPPAADPRPALTVSCPSGATASTESAPVPVTFPAPSASGGVTPVRVTCTRDSGSMFAVGTTSVQCTATDAAGQSASCLFNVTVNVVTPRLSRTKFLAFGDSMTAGEVTFPTSSGQGADGTPIFKFIVVPSAAYPTRLAALLRERYTTQASSIDVTNAGLPGEWAQDGVRRLPGVLLAARPDVVLLLEGINDVGTQLDLGVIRAAQALDSMAKEARNRGARVVLATVPPPRPGGSRSLSPKLVTDLNAWIRQIASGEGAVLVDLYSAMLPDVTKYMGLDGLHPTEAGYQKIAELFFEAIRRDLEVR